MVLINAKKIEDNSILFYVEWLLLSRVSIDLYYYVEKIRSFEFNAQSI